MSALSLVLNLVLKRMEWMLNHLNNPQLNIRGIHVGGTNGKGSTVAYLRAH